MPERSDYDLLSIDEVARIVGQSERHLRRMIRDGEFPKGFPAPKTLRWRWSVVRDWIIRLEQKADILVQSRTSGTDGEKPSSEKRK